jgi:hypothetical protein
MSLRTWIAQVAESVFFNSDEFNSTNVQDAIIEAKQNAEGFPRAGIPLIQNGISGNGDLISYSNLTPDTDIVFPVKTKLNEMTIGNTSTSVEFDLRIYKNGTAPGDLVTTINVSTGSSRNAFFDLNSSNIIFEAGDYAKIEYIDQGTNAGDLVVVLWISRIPE